MNINYSNNIINGKEKLGIFCYKVLHYLLSAIVLFESGFGLIVNICCRITMKKKVQLICSKRNYIKFCSTTTKSRKIVEEKNRNKEQWQ